jgi:hypothetical protein
MDTEEDASEMEHVYEDTNLKMFSYLYPLLPASDQIRDCVMSAYFFQVWKVCDVIRVFPCFIASFYIPDYIKETSPGKHNTTTRTPYRLNSTRNMRANRLTWNGTAIHRAAYAQLCHVLVPCA